MIRKGIFFKLKPGALTEYKRRHDAIWSEMREVLDCAGMRNYSIWNEGEMLFAYYEVKDEARAERILAGSDVYQKWCDWMEEVIYVEPGSGKKEWPMDMVFFHE